VILLPHTSTTEACGIAERLRRGASALAVLTGDGSVRATISIGVAALYQHGRDLFELLAAADLALYRAKHTGRDRICLYDPDEAADHALPQGTLPCPPQAKPAVPSPRVAGRTPPGTEVPQA
jgi:predicted signal transduction protein with EAL and GGDEF domain